MSVFPCTFQSIIGEGGFGVVYKAVSANGSIVAVKEVKVDAQKKALIEREIDVMAKLNHPNIVRYLGSMYKDSKYYIALEYCQGGDLENYLKSVGKVNKQIALYWFKQLVSALSYLQLNNCMHRDIKPANLYLNSLDPGSADIKIGDFGFSKSLMNNITNSKLGTPLYMAPEMFTENSYDYRADVWSLGCVIYELIEGSPIFYATSIRQLIEMQKYTPKFSDKFTPQEAEFILYTVRYYPSDRPDFLQLENSYFIQNIQKPVLQVEHIVKNVDNSPILLSIDKKLNEIVNVLSIIEDIIDENRETTYFFVAYLESRSSVIGNKLGSLRPQNFENSKKETEFWEIERKLRVVQEWVERFKKTLSVAYEDFKVNSGSLAEFTNLLIPKSYEYEDTEVQLMLIEACKYFDQANELVSERLLYLQSKSKILVKKKKFSSEDINFLTTLSKESLESLSESLTREQKEKIYEILSTPKVPSWINSTIKIHKSTPDLKTTLPKLSEKKDFRKVIEMIMISAGDYSTPNPQSVNLLYKNLKSFLRRISKLKKKTLYNKFPKINAKYGSSHQPAFYVKQEDEESFSENENSPNIDMKNIERLQFNDFRTNQMTEEEYMKFTECRKVSFTKYGKEAFLKWSGATKNIRFLGWVARERVFEIVENSIRNRDHQGKLSIISTPLAPNELVFTE